MARALAARILDRLSKITELQGELNTLRRNIRGNCTHLTTKEYRWTHDTGFGRQTDHVGKQCIVCLAVDLYADGRWTYQG